MYPTTTTLTKKIAHAGITLPSERSPRIGWRLARKGGDAMGDGGGGIGGGFIIAVVCPDTSNETKMSDGGRRRVSIGVEVWKSSQKWSVQRSAVRSIAWLGALRGFTGGVPSPAS